MFPQVTSMRGTLEWQVSFPSADIYEDLTLAGVAVITSKGQTSVVSGMTLPEFQLKSAQH